MVFLSAVRQVYWYASAATEFFFKLPCTSPLPEGSSFQYVEERFSSNKNQAFVPFVNFRGIEGR